MHSKQACRRRHSAQLKDKVLAACAEPGASVAAVALAHDLNANLVHKWRRANAGPLSPTQDVTAPQPVAPSLLQAALAATPTAGTVAGRLEATARQAAAATSASRLPDVAATFVPVRLERPRAATDIRIELHRGAATVIVTWPAPEAAACGSWLREWLG